ncbi:F-box family protein [Striga asiatica]|uniref:F-box family protein n=1 Tax=Striga asiatica TaxID=4170 RepID=A0A5A7P311_STRAF|nr:F-box family protein [Striga asiatica]
MEYPSPIQTEMTSGPGPRSPRAQKLDPSAQLFPPGITIEILSRMPLKDAARLQLVSKEWHSLIQSHYFKDRHMAHSEVLYHHHNVKTNWAHTSARCSFSFANGRDGLLLMQHKTQNTLCLWNPATKRALELPGPNPNSLGLSLTFSRATGSYSIVSFHRDSEKIGSEGCEVLDPCGARVWRPVLDFPEAMIVRGESHWPVVISTGEAAHCVFFAENEIGVVSLDVETDKFAASRFLPKTGRADDYWALEWEGKLVIAGVVGSNMEVKEMEDHGKGRWGAEERIVALPAWMKKEAEGGNEIVPLLVRDGEMWFWIKGCGVVFTCNVETGERTDYGTVRNFMVSTRLYPYKESLIGFQGMVPETMFDRFLLE